MNNDNRQKEEAIVIGNEFTIVQVRKHYTRNGERLEIFTPKLGYRILLDPLELESLTWQKKDVFSKFLENSFGPVDK